MNRDASVVLLSELIDYAGLFPPTGQAMREAVHHYRQYRESRDSWVLGRLIIPLTRLGEFGEAIESEWTAPAGPAGWRISCLWPAAAVQSAATVAAALGTMDEFTARLAGRAGRGALVLDVIEVPCDREEEIRCLGDQLPDRLRAFVEIAWSAPWEGKLATIRQYPHLAAKIRTGGLTPEAIVATDRLAAFLQAATCEKVPFKFTAGLHHPLPGDRPLTYQPDAPRGVMHGFWNVGLAAGLFRAGRIDTQRAERLLCDQDPNSFDVAPDGLAWQSLRLSTAEIAQLRQDAFISFGSCSFTEPIVDLRALHWLPEEVAPVGAQ